MKISKDYPPNIDEIKKVLTPSPGAVFTYGDTLYNPSNGIIDDPLMAHEEIHSLRQGKDPAGWWERYLKEPSFRLSEELRAYQEQYQVYLLEGHERNKIAMFSYQLAKDLAGPMYGNVITVLEARQKIIG